MWIAVVLLLAGQAVDPNFELKTWGGPGATRFTVTLTVANELHVVHESLPITAEGALTRSTISVPLSPDDAAALIRSAQAVDDFDEGCAAVADGTNASLVVATSSPERRLSCDGAREWPIGPQAKAFLQAINKHLPEAHRVY